ncbi:tRNA-i(6)A37 thiotransferase enzyme MiaB [Escherichia coli]|uniref:tRNA-i(6)A37 thiotransferase enzyme MiaB n=1 Tax=Escherichia coli TaxID=562 RepID=A0A2X1N0D8_ECOLX|nr:tRNA-i(6)A37 thiotransferase enzyme MiaB [Escherichia coli]
MVNFEGTPDMIGKFVDVEITDVYPNSLRGKVVRTEDEMGLRVAETPESVIARTRKENDLGVVIISRNSQPAVPVGLVFLSLSPSLLQCLRLFPVA